MKVKRLSFILASIWMLCAAQHAQARPASEPWADSDSIRISLLTCAAGEEIYSLFGHTALRYENYTRGTDVVFNYGIFDFSAPNFVLRFALGETDYRLGTSSYERFIAEYSYLGRDVWQQVLNLKQDEKVRLVKLLEENYQPENRVYRYNFFYDNCATRPRDMVEKAISGKLVYAEDMDTPQQGTTFRDILRQYSAGHLWSRFGMDLCMGSKADEPISRRVQMFVPFYVQSVFSKARIQDEQGGLRPLVVEERKVVEVESHPASGWLDRFTPQWMSCLLFVLTLCCTLYGVWRGKSLWGIDLVLFLAAGLAGCILAFLTLFSQHPAVSPNYLLFVFHPFHLLCLPFFLPRVRRGLTSRYMIANFVVLTFFIVSIAVIPQRFDLAVLPLALSLLVRSGGNLLTARKINSRQRRTIHWT